MANSLKIRHNTREIVMDRVFAIKSSTVGTDEYNSLQEARRDYPKYKVVRRSNNRTAPPQEHYKGLTYEFMKQYIADHDAERKDDFEELLGLAKCHSIRYQAIKEWFLGEYSEVVEYYERFKKSKEEKTNNTTRNELQELIG